MVEQLIPHVESLIFSAETPISAGDLKKVLETVLEVNIQESVLQQTLDQLIAKYQEGNFAIEVVEIADGYQFMTKGAFHSTIAEYLKLTTRKRLSRAALETLSIIAYKQPVSKTELEQIRGVNCDYSIQKLLEKELVSIVGRSEGPGRPLLYATSEKFMDYFGLKSLKDLPKLKEFEEPENSIGEQAPIEEDEEASS